MVENTMRGVEYLLILPCKRIEKTYRRTTKGLEQKGLA